MADPVVSNFDNLIKQGNAGVHVCAAWGAITHWLFKEARAMLHDQRDLAIHDAVMRQAMVTSYTIIKDSYEHEGEDTLDEGMTVGMKYGGESLSNKVEFRSFMKNLGVTGAARSMDNEEVGDLGMLLLTTLEIVKKYEKSEVVEKVESEIKDICIHQLDCENILEDIQSSAEKYFETFKDALLDMHPISN